ncbi:MAG: hypothetical protein FD137_218 [Spirochaetes bacterium]|nr:MAG: hypothetical protein FD137_218 [Spirochaetota bacterium]
MELSHAATLTGAILVVGSAEKKISGGYTSDLLSDVMAHAKTGDALVTIQAHKNTVAVASLVGAPAIFICNNRPIPEDMIEAAAAEDIALLKTALSQFEASGRLWSAFSPS